MTEGVTRLTARTPVDLLALVPHRLGFHPTDSLVIMPLGQAGITVRADLPMLADVGRSADYLARSLVHHGVTQVAIIVYADDDHPVHQAMVDSLTGRLQVAGVAIKESIRTNGARWFSYTCPGVCCPAEGTEYSLEQSPLGTQYAVQMGSAPLSSRQALGSTLDPLPEFPDLVALEIGHQLDALDGQVTALTNEEAGLFLKRRMRRQVELLINEKRPPTVAEAASLVLYTQSIPARDVAWSLITEVGNRSQHLTLWRDVLRRTPDTFHTPVATLTAMAAYLCGDGALAELALARVTDPGYSLAGLLRMALAQGMDPAKWTPAPEVLEGTES